MSRPTTAADSPITPGVPGVFGCDDWANVPATPTAFGWHYDVYPGLLPFEYLHVDRFEWFTELADFLDSQPATSMTFTLPQLADHLGVPVQRLVNHLGLELFLLIHNAPELETTGRERRFLNPNYIHDPTPPVTDATERLLWLYRYGSTGIHKANAVAPLFGVGSGSAVRSFADRWDVAWGPLCRQGRRRLARTLFLTHEWTGRSYASMARALGLTAFRVYDMVQRLVEDADGFETVPPDPSGLKDFTLDSVSDS